MAGPSGASYRKTKSDVQAGSGNPFSRKDAEGAEDFPPGSDPGRGRAAERGGILNYRTKPYSSKNLDDIHSAALLNYLLDLVANCI